MMISNYLLNKKKKKMTSNSFGIWIREFPKKEIELLGRIKKKSF